MRCKIQYCMHKGELSPPFAVEVVKAALESRVGDLSSASVSSSSSQASKEAFLRFSVLAQKETEPRLLVFLNRFSSFLLRFV